MKRRDFGDRDGGDRPFKPFRNDDAPRESGSNFFDRRGRGGSFRGDRGGRGDARGGRGERRDAPRGPKNLLSTENFPTLQ
jgi:hypothetical protein